MARSLIFAPALGALMLVACGDNDARTPQPPIDEAESAVPLPDAPPFGAGWSMVSSGEGVALRLEEGGDLIAAVACTRDPAGLRAESDRFERVMSEDRFTVGAGDVVEEELKALMALSPDALRAQRAERFYAIGRF